MTEIKHCRICNAQTLLPILSLGRTPLANALLIPEQLNQIEATYPLELVFCPNCTLVQITETVPPEVLFRHYLYLSSFSDTMIMHSMRLTKQVIADRHLDQNSLVVEIASNDGYLLNNYVQAGIPVLGIEPAKNIAGLANEKGISTLGEFFNKELATSLVAQGYRADVIHANNVLAHVAELNSVVSGIKLLLKEDGVAIIEAPYLRDMIEHVEFDTIYHEHLCYFSLMALDFLFRAHSLYIVDVERLAIHGGSLRIFVQHQDHPAPSVHDLLQQERAWHMDQHHYYADFGNRVTGLREDLRRLLDSVKAQGQRVAIYGASAKGNTLLNYFDIGQQYIEFVVDRSTVKQGKYTPGTRLPIYAPEKLLETMPDYVLLLTWNFADEILAQQAEYRKQGGKFIIPIPEVQVI